MYTHEALTDHLAIRVLHLQPANDFAAPLQAHLENRVEHGEYEALSYTWDGSFDGELLPFDRLDIRGANLTIKGNLSAALRQLRMPDHARSLWIDAVCIDQTNGEERSFQVSRMGTIYRNAQKVIAWLGEDSSLQDGKFVFDLSVQKPIDRSISTAFAATVCQRFLERRYFQRRWVVQELLTARDLEVRCGTYTTSLPELIDGLKTMQRTVTLLDTRDYQYRHMLDTISSMWSSSRSRSSLRSHDGLHVLRLFGHLDCQDPRDRIYAFTSLYNRPIDVGYSLEVEDVYNMFATTTISYNREVQEHSYDNFNTMLYASACQIAQGLRDDSSRLFSWSPDWRLPWPVEYVITNAEPVGIKVTTMQIHDDASAHLTVLEVWLSVFGTLCTEEGALQLTLEDTGDIRIAKPASRNATYNFVRRGANSYSGPPRIENGDLLCKPVGRFELWKASMATILRPKYKACRDRTILMNAHGSERPEQEELELIYVVAGLCRIEMFDEPKLTTARRRVLIR